LFLLATCRKKSAAVIQGRKLH